jgi:sulfur carrier protein ThiS
VTLKIEVELSPVFQTAFQSSSVLIELDEDEGTVKGLLRRLSSESEGKISSLLFEEGSDSILPGLMVMVNNRVFTGPALNEQVIRLQDKDKVSLLYFVSGGWDDQTTHWLFRKPSRPRANLQPLPYVRVDLFLPSPPGRQSQA